VLVPKTSRTGVKNANDRDSGYRINNDHWESLMGNPFDD
jgi:hypothetical protein